MHIYWVFSFWLWPLVNVCMMTLHSLLIVCITTSLIITVGLPYMQYPHIIAANIWCGQTPELWTSCISGANTHLRTTSACSVHWSFVNTLSLLPCVPVCLTKIVSWKPSLAWSPVYFTDMWALQNSQAHPWIGFCKHQILSEELFYILSTKIAKHWTMSRPNAKHPNRLPSSC